MPLAYDARVVALRSEVGCPVGRLSVVIELKHAGQCVAPGRDALGPRIAVSKSQPFLRQGVDIWSLYPGLGLRVSTDGPNALVVGKDVENIWAIGD